MKITEHYAKATQPLISFEIIPPKRGSSIKPLFESLDQISKFNPPFIDVTSHAAEAYYEELPDGTVKRHIKRKRPGTIGLCAAIKHKYNVDPVPHIICKGFSKEETEDALIELGVISNKLDWIQKYNDLYNEISIKLEGLPSIAIKIIKE